MQTRIYRLLTAIGLLALPVLADDLATPVGSFSGSLRYRYDLFDREETAFPHTANASTLRLAAGFETKQWAGFSGFAEMQSVSVLGTSDYTIPTIPGFAKAGYPTVNDPPNVVALNQGYVRWRFEREPVKLKITAGRQEALLNDGRFLSFSAWRQFHQSFDGIQMAAELPFQLTASYSFFDRAHRTVGPDALDGQPRMATHVITTGWSKKKTVNVSMYALLLDNHLPLSVWNAPSTSTVGVRLTGPYEITRAWSLLYTAEYAKQRDYANNPYQVNANYILTELGPSWRGMSLKGGFAVLGGRSTTDKLSTPLSPPMNGWTELFGSNPSLRNSHGLDARYLTLSNAPRKGFTWTGTFYDYHSAFNRIHYGQEADAMLTYSVKQTRDRLELGWRLGYYWADKLYGTGIRSALFTSFRM